jgi:glycosyltransferase involved in cell wall biosynthesis
LRGTPSLFSINTLLPFGAALAGKFYGVPVVYHLHETSIRPRLLKRFLFLCVQKFASHSIYVSKFLIQAEPRGGSRKHVVPNALDDAFMAKARASAPTFAAPFHVVMVCSLKAYKGVNEFVELARRMDDLRFDLVLNASPEEIGLWASDIQPHINLRVLGPLRDLHPVYSTAHIVLNLSHPDQWVETFGLTALEAMAYGVPVIVPKCGGIAELVRDGEEGFKCDVRDLTTIIDGIRHILKDRSTYIGFSERARRRAADFDLSSAIDRVEQILCEASQAW